MRLNSTASTNDVEMMLIIQVLKQIQLYELIRAHELFSLT